MTRTILWWLMLAVLALGAGLLVQRVQLPGGWLIGPLAVALAVGLAQAQHRKVPGRAFRAAQAVIGILLASAFRPSVLPLIAAHWLPVLLIVAGTLAVSLLNGIVLARVSSLDRETAALGTLPGGASGMIAMSVSLEADTRMVALMQYIRLALVVVSASLLARFVLPGGTHGHHGGVTILPTPPLGPHPWFTYGRTLLIAVVGVWVGRLLRLPAAALLGTLLVGLVATAAFKQPLAWPPGVVEVAYATVGIYVGLLFDRDSVRQAGRLVPVVMASTLLLMATCAAMGWALARVTGATFLTGYLATTPGGMDSITVVAMGSGADVSLMLAVQMARLLAIVFTGPLLARFLARGKNERPGSSAGKLAAEGQSRGAKQ